MKILLVLFSAGFLSLGAATKSTSAFPGNKTNGATPEKNLSLQYQPNQRGIAAIEFKAQEYCRAEMPKDFEFDVKFTVLSANVYFTGAGFPNVESGYINSNSLKSIKHLMDKCKPGSIVVFDNIKVKGPGDEVRTLESVSMRLY